MGALLNIKPLDMRRVLKAKRAFTTRRVPVGDMRTLVNGPIRPLAGDLVLARVREIGKHTKIERPDGRRAQMLPGDEIIVCYGNRYAPDQFEARVSEDLSPCDLVAGGGIAGREVCRHDRMQPPTAIEPLGLIGDVNGERLNIARYAISPVKSQKDIKVVVVAGTAMNSGKTFTAASLIRGIAQRGVRVAGLKATGTGSGGDLWLMKDFGAHVVADFTDVGFASTYLAPDTAIADGFSRLSTYAANLKCEVAIIEIADGLQHRETATLLQTDVVRRLSCGVVFAAFDSMGAKAGYEMLSAMGHDVIAISGKIARSPLAVREANASTACPVLCPFDIQHGALFEAIMRPETRGVRQHPAAMPPAEEPPAHRNGTIDLGSRALMVARQHSRQDAEAFAYPVAPSEGPA